MESAGETILSVPPLLHLLAIQQQQQKQKQQQQNNGNNSDMNNAEGGEVCSSSSNDENQQQQHQMLIVLKQQEHCNGTNGAGADGSGALASDEEDRQEEKRTKKHQEEEQEQHQQQGKLEIVEESTTPPPLFRQQTMQFGDEMMDVKIEPSKDLQIQIPPLNVFNGYSTPLMAQSAATTPTEQQASKPLPVIKPPGDEKEERPSLSYKDLIIEAIENSSERRLKLSEIYQVIKYLHPYYQRRSDQWGWQNSIRHNLSLHDCFVKLPLKQTSANGVVGHFWTVVTRGPDEKPLGPTRRRTRGTGKAKKGMAVSMALNGAHNGGNSSTLSAGIKNGTIKGLKGRQSVSSDSGVMSDEGGACSHSNSPTELGTRSVPLLHAHMDSTASLFHFHRPTVQTPTQQIQQQHVQAGHSPVPASSGNLSHHPLQQNLSPLELVLQLQHQHNQQQHHQQQQQHLQAVQQQPFASLQQFSPIPKITTGSAAVGADEANNAPAAASTPTLMMPNDATGDVNAAATVATNNTAFLPCELQQLLAIAALSQHQFGTVVAAAQQPPHHQQQQQPPVVTVSAANNSGNNNNNNTIAFQSPPAADNNAMTLLQLLNTAGTSSGGGPPTDGGLGLLSHLATQLAPNGGSPSSIAPQANSSSSNLLASAAAAATAELQRLHMIQLAAQQQQQQLQQQLAALLEQQQLQHLQFQQREATNPAASALSDVLSVAAGCQDQSSLVAQLLLSRLMHSPAATSTSSSSNGSAYEQHQQQMNGQPPKNSSPPPPPPAQNNNAMMTAQYLMDLQRTALLLDQQQYQQVQAQQTELSNRREMQAVPQQQQSLDIDTKQEMDQQQELTVV